MPPTIHNRVSPRRARVETALGQVRSHDRRRPDAVGERPQSQSTHLTCERSTKVIFTGAGLTASYGARILPARLLPPSENNVRSVCSLTAAFMATGFPYRAFLPVPVSSSRCATSLSGMTTTVQAASRASIRALHVIVCGAPV
jgi:hypothetical protein